MNADAVADGIDRAHREISILQYNDENSLSCTINLAFYFAREYYTIIRELPTGKGFEDICFVPRKLHADNRVKMGQRCRRSYCTDKRETIRRSIERVSRKPAPRGN